MLYRLGEHTPQVAHGCYVADNASVIGRVRLGAGASVWFNAVLRGDNDLIDVGEAANVQDHALLHADPGVPLRLGRGVSIGHHAALHGCEVGDFTLVGIGARVLNGARIGPHCVIGAHTLVPQDMVVPEGSLVFGSPGRVLRQLEPHERAELEHMAALYQRNGDKFLRELEALPPVPHPGMPAAVPAPAPTETAAVA